MKNKTIIALSRIKVLPETLALGRAMVNKDYNNQEGKKKQLQGKIRAKILMREIHDHSNRMNTHEQNNDTHHQQRNSLYSSLTLNDSQFKKE